MEAAVYDIGMAAGVAFILCLGFLCLKKGFEPRFSEAGTLLCQGAIMLGSALTLLFSVKYFLAAASAYIVLAFFVQALGLFKARTSGELTRPGAAAMLSAAMLFLEVTAALSYLLYDAGYMAEGVTAKKLFFFVSVWAILGIGFYKSLKERIAPPETPPKIRVYQNVFLITVAFLEIFLVNYIIIEVIRSNSLYMTLVVIAMIALLAFDTSFVIFIQRMERTRSMERRLELERQQRALEENYYATVEHQYQSSLAMIHRMEDHIQRLKDYYDRGEAGAARRYAEKTLEEIAGTGMSLGCRDRTLAIILEDKRFVCERRGIVLSVRDESRGLGFMDVFDITTIFSNLLDNAIQAAQRLDGAEVEVSLFEYGQMLGINVENPYVEAPVKRGAVFLSTKSGAGHGVGLKNVAAAVKKYQGEMDIRTDDGIFKVQILLPLARETED